MVTERQQRQDAAGRWLCNIVDGCDQAAVVQSVFLCETGCDAASEQLERLIAQKRAEADQHERALEIVRDEMQRAAEAGEPAQLSATERAAIELGRESLKHLRADVEKLEAARGRVAAEHTHPVFACDRHEKKLQQHAAYAAGRRSLENPAPATD